MPNKKRELWADNAKGLGILLVFIGHLDALPQIIRVFIYLFHMPLFFFCMGFYCNTSTDWKTYLKKTILHLLVPFYAYSVFNILLQTFKQLLLSSGFHWDEIAKLSLGMLINVRNSAFPSQYWFLITSFVAYIYYYLLRNYIKKIQIELFFVVGMSILLTYLSRFSGVALPWYLDVAFPCLLFMYLGAAVKKKESDFGRKKVFLLGIIGIVSAVLIYCILEKNGEKFLVDYHMLKLFPYSLVTIGGVSLCIFVYAFFKRFDKKTFLTYIGENSLIYFLFDRFPISLVGKLLSHFHITNVFVSACAKLLGIIAFTPFIVMFIKYFFWFLFGKKKEAWSFDYSRLARKR